MTNKNDAFNNRLKKYDRFQMQLLSCISISGINIDEAEIDFIEAIVEGGDEKIKETRAILEKTLKRSVLSRENRRFLYSGEIKQVETAILGLEVAIKNQIDEIEGAEKSAERD